jgi:hypothetical protein
MRVACWIRNAACTHAQACTHTHTQKCNNRIAFPQQQWFREGASVLRYTYVACLVKFDYVVLIISLARVLEIC